MIIHCDITEPGLIPQALGVLAGESGIVVSRSILHKRTGSGGALRARHPFYGLGADYVIATSDGVRLAAIERKSMDDLARSVTGIACFDSFAISVRIPARSSFSKAPRHPSIRR